MSVSDLGEYSGYRALWASVLLQAIKDMDVEKQAPAAKWWMYQDPSTGPGSFVWVCLMLDLDESRMATTCLTRQGRWKILGPQYTGLHKFIEHSQEGKPCPPKRKRRNREPRRTSRSRKK